MTSAYSDAVEAHYTAVWSAPQARLTWDRGPVHDLAPDFSVLFIQRSPATSAYATRCLSVPEEPEPLELHLLTRRTGEPVAELVELLTTVAHFHRTGARLGLAHSVNFGRPWLPGSQCDRGVISLPYLDGPRLEWLESPRSRFLWLVPVTASEIAFKQRHGLEALEDRFEKARFDYLDAARQPVV